MARRSTRGACGVASFIVALVISAGSACGMQAASQPPAKQPTDETTPAAAKPKNTKALVANGVESARLVPVGYGAFCPAKQSIDDVDEMLNRRVMFRVVQTNYVWTGVPRGCWSASTQKVDPTKKKPLVIETHGGGM